VGESERHSNLGHVFLLTLKNVLLSWLMTANFSHTVKLLSGEIGACRDHLDACEFPYQSITLSSEGISLNPALDFSIYVQEGLV
jgi:hypothetical protein